MPAHKKRKKYFSLPQKQKVVFIVIDGMADLPIGNKTPLSEAKKPNMNYFAANGLLGETVPVEKKLWDQLVVAGSHVANIGLLGYDPKKMYLARGPIEAVGADVPFKEGELALRCNFANVDSQMTMVNRRAGRNFQGLEELANEINKNVDIGVPFIFKRTYEHRAVLVIKKELSDQISSNDPHAEGAKTLRIQGLSKEGEETAGIVQDFVDKSHWVLKDSSINKIRIKNGSPPANFIIARQAGNLLPHLDQKFVKDHKVKAVVIAENGVMKGTCMLAGFDAVTVPELKHEQTLKFIFSNIWESLDMYDLIYAHIKGPDEYSHDGDFFGKQKEIERVDVFLEKFKNFDGILIVTCDHITSTKNKRHEHGPVPFLIYGSKMKDKIKSFDEFSAKKGKLGLIAPSKLWKLVLGK